MKFNKVFLVGQPIGADDLPIAYHPPVGLGYIAESLNQHGIDYRVVDMAARFSDNYLIREVRRFQPDLIGISMLTAGYRRAYKLLERIKDIFPHIPIAAGGPYVSSLGERALADCSSIDYGVVLEGDETIIELCNGMAPEDIKGLIWRNDESICRNGDREFIIDLDRIAFPTYKWFRLDRYARKTIAIATSRGCPYSCIFCSVHTTMGRKFRSRSAQNVVEELKYWYKQGYRDIWIQDDNFALVPERVREICALIENGRLEGLRLALPNGLRADKVDRDLLKRMKEVNFVALAIGVESGSEKVLERIKKGEDLHTIESAISSACELGFDVSLFFIIGHPSERWEDVEASFAVALKYPIDRVFFYNLVPFPGTELYEWIDSNNYFLKNPSDYLNNPPASRDDPCFETPDLTYNERRKAFAQALEVARKVDSNRIRRRLSKYDVFIQWLGSKVYISGWFQRFYRYNPVFYNMVYKLRGFLGI